MAQQTISKMETVQTAVEWLFEKMAQTPMTNWYEVREQALAMEKEQIINSYEQGEDYGCWHLENGYNKDFESAEQYYNETFNK